MKARMVRGLLALSIALAVVWTALPLQAQAAGKLPAPTGVKAQSVSVTSVKVSWKAVSGAAKYEVYRATSAKGTYKKIKTTTSAAYTNKGLSKGKTYYYKVKAIHRTASRSSGWSAVVSGKARLATPAVKAQAVSSTSIKVSWAAVTGAKKYEVYRATSAKGTYKKIKTTTSTAYTNKGLSKGKTYYYKVKALSATSSANSALSAAVSARTGLTAPKGLRVTVVSPTSLVLAWGKVSGATAYEVSRATSAAGTYTRIATTKGTSYTNTGLARNRTYYYKVRALAGSARGTLSAAAAGKTAYARGTSKTLGRGTTAVGRNVTFRYTAPVGGVYRFNAVDRTGNHDVTIQVFDASGSILTGYNCVNGANATLSAGQTYRVVGIYNMNACTFTMQVGVPHVAWNITGSTSVTDGIGFVGQQNVYYYTAPVTGRYRLDVVDRMDDESVRIEAFNSKSSSLGVNYNGLTVDLTAGQTYRFVLSNPYALCTSYRLNIGVAHAVKTITGQTTLTDGITFCDQVNRYAYKAAETGRYRFDIADRMDDASVRVQVYDSLNRSVNGSQYNGLTVDLTAGQTYRVEVFYWGELCTSYRVNIGVPHAVKTLTDGTALSDALTYTGQINRYDFTPAYTGECRIRLRDITNDADTYVEVYDNLNRRVAGSWSDEFTCTMTAGTKYRILVEQSNGFCTYTITAGIVN